MISTFMSAREFQGQQVVSLQKQISQQGVAACRLARLVGSHSCGFCLMERDTQEIKSGVGFKTLNMNRSCR